MKTSLLQKVRAVSFNLSGVLPPATPHSDNGKKLLELGRTLGALRFLGCRLAALDPSGKDRLHLETFHLLECFDLIFPENPSTPQRPIDFRILAGALNLAPTDILHVGTDLKADVNTALAAGMRAAWLAPLAHFHPRGAVALLSRLDDLPLMLRDADTANLCRKPSGREFRNLVAMLRGLPTEPRPGPRYRNENPIHTIGSDILRTISTLRIDAAPIDALRRHWTEIIGTPTLSSDSEPHRISPTGTLSVLCANAIVREELRRWHAKAVLTAAQTIVPSVKKVSFHL
ncbi:MAG: DciA family protein [Puniceicoccales bacterium]|nr:DciA family protein [Puniceicoccales bacterium]